MVNGVWEHNRSTQRLRLAVVVLNYRTPELVLDCLETLVGQVEPGRDELVVVDNASGDGSEAAIRAGISERGWGGWARVVAADRNGGFSSGNNAGIRASDAAFYLLLNSDTLLRPGALAELLNAAVGRPRAGLVGPRLEWSDELPQESAFRRLTPLSQLVQSSQLSFVARALGRHVVAKPVSDQPHQADWVSFACVLVRREALERVGPMDEGMFMYYEDIDMGCRVRRAGFEVWYWPSARVVHLRGGSGDVKKSKEAHKRLPGYYYAARARYLHREFGRLGLWAANVLWIAGTMLNHACKLVTGRPVHLPERAWRDVWITKADTPAGPRGVSIEPEVEPLFGERDGSAEGGVAGVAADG
jgi:GT2 family glycosyltransferase